MTGTETSPPRSRQRRSVGHLSIETFATRADMGVAAAGAVGEAIVATLSRQARARMIFAAARSQVDMLDALRGFPGIDWSRVTAFHMDEYVGLAAAAPQRFAVWLDAHLFTRLPFGEVHRIMPGEDLEEECRRYAGLLCTAPIDIVCLGIGSNGHIAFNDPPVADFADPLGVKVVDLDADCRQQQVDDECFPSLDLVPTRAITVTIPPLLRGGRLVCVVPGALKRDAVARTLRGPISVACPASILRTHAACTLYLDVESDPDA